MLVRSGDDCGDLLFQLDNFQFIRGNLLVSGQKGGEGLSCEFRIFLADGGFEAAEICGDPLVQRRSRTFLGFDAGLRALDAG
ncbi:hypothetical protein D3C73_1492700 [compost metagenome]